MTTKNGSGKVEEYQSKTLDAPIAYTFDYNVYDNLTEAKQSEDWPNDNDVLRWVNQTAERTAKAASYQKAVADLKKEYEASPEFKRKELIKNILALGKSQAEAEALAASIIGA